MATDPSYYTISTSHGALCLFFQATIPAETPSSSSHSVGEGPLGVVQGGASYGTYPSEEDDLPLLEELGIDIPHIRSKAITVLNPFR